MKQYGKFGIMIAVSTFIMYWLMYVNVFISSLPFFSQSESSLRLKPPPRFSELWGLQ